METSVQKNKSDIVVKAGLGVPDRLLLLTVLVLQALMLVQYRNERLAKRRRPPVDDGVMSSQPSGTKQEIEAQTLGVGAQHPDRSVTPRPPPTPRSFLGWPVVRRRQTSAREAVGLLVNRDWERLQRSPAMDVVETDDAYIVLFSLADVSLDDISVRMDRGILTVDLPFQLDQERGYGRQVRRLQIPGVVPDLVKPSVLVTNGFLRVHLPKH